MMKDLTVHSTFDILRFDILFDVAMPYHITDSCTACDLCLDVCPIGAIEPGDPIYVIDEALCCDFEECLVMCPEDAIVLVEDDA